MRPHPLTRLRHQLNLTQKQLSRRSGVSIRTIANIETYTHRPQHNTRRLLLRALFRDDPNFSFAPHHRGLFPPTTQEKTTHSE
jgi:transcriptional regulator with XRE-family HTH domain